MVICLDYLHSFGYVLLFRIMLGMLVVLKFIFLINMLLSKDAYLLCETWLCITDLIIFCFSYQELRRLKEKYEMLTVELEKTKADNVQLYGKIRYVQDYSQDKIVSRGPKKVLLKSLWSKFLLFYVFWHLTFVAYCFAVCRRYWKWFFRCWSQVQENVRGWHKSICCFLKEGGYVFWYSISNNFMYGIA